jgi:hypothetical protein
MLQVFYLEVAYVSHKCYKCMFQMFQLFQSYVVASVFMLQVFHSYFKRILLDGTVRVYGAHLQGGASARSKRRRFPRVRHEAGAGGLCVHARRKRRGRGRSVRACRRVKRSGLWWSPHTSGQLGTHDGGGAGVRTLVPPYQYMPSRAVDGQVRGGRPNRAPKFMGPHLAFHSPVLSASDNQKSGSKQQHAFARLPSS